MRRVPLAVLVVALFLAPVAVAGAAPPPAGYLIGSSAPLTAAQVAQLKNAGAQVKHVYRNFGGASAVISGGRVDRVRALPFVTSVNADTVKQLAAAPAAPAPGPLPGTPYWQDQMNLENVSET